MTGWVDRVKSIGALTGGIGAPVAVSAVATTAVGFSEVTTVVATAMTALISAVIWYMRHNQAVVIPGMNKDHRDDMDRAWGRVEKITQSMAESIKEQATNSRIENEKLAERFERSLQKIVDSRNCQYRHPGGS